MYPPLPHTTRHPSRHACDHSRQARQLSSVHIRTHAHTRVCALGAREHIWFASQPRSPPLLAVKAPARAPSYTPPTFLLRAALLGVRVGRRPSDPQAQRKDFRDILVVNFIQRVPPSTPARWLLTCRGVSPHPLLTPTVSLELASAVQTVPFTVPFTLPSHRHTTTACH